MGQFITLSLVSTRKLYVALSTLSSSLMSPGSLSESLSRQKRSSAGVDGTYLCVEYV